MVSSGVHNFVVNSGQILKHRHCAWMVISIAPSFSVEPVLLENAIWYSRRFIDTNLFWKHKNDSMASTWPKQQEHELEPLQLFNNIFTTFQGYTKTESVKN